jgi:hypothetical protein
MAWPTNLSSTRPSLRSPALNPLPQVAMPNCPNKTHDLADSALHQPLIAHPRKQNLSGDELSRLVVGKSPRKELLAPSTAIPKAALWVAAALVAVILIAYVPGAIAGSVEIAMVEDPAPGALIAVGLNVAEMPVGRLGADSEISELKPPETDVQTVADAEAPGSIPNPVDTAKSPGAVVATVTFTAAPWELPPPEAFTTRE